MDLKNLIILIGTLDTQIIKIIKMKKMQVTFEKGKYGRWEQPVYYIIYEHDTIGQEFFYSSDLVAHINDFLNRGFEITIKK